MKIEKEDLKTFAGMIRTLRRWVMEGRLLEGEGDQILRNRAGKCVALRARDADSASFASMLEWVRQFWLVPMGFWGSVGMKAFGVAAVSVGVNPVGRAVAAFGKPGALKLLRAARDHAEELDKQVAAEQPKKKGLGPMMNRGAWDPEPLVENPEPPRWTAPQPGPELQAAMDAALRAVGGIAPAIPARGTFVAANGMTFQELTRTRTEGGLRGGRP